MSFFNPQFNKHFKHKMPKVLAMILNSHTHLWLTQSSGKCTLPTLRNVRNLHLCPFDTTTKNHKSLKILDT